MFLRLRPLLPHQNISFWLKAKRLLLAVRPGSVLACVLSLLLSRPRPFPGVVGAPGDATIDTALLTSMVHHMDRLANPDISPKPGAMGCIRRNGEIHVCVARFLDHRAVALRPGADGEQPAACIKSLNERLRPLYDSYRLPSGFPNRVCLGAACSTWGGREKDGDWVITEAEFRSRAPHEFDKSTPPAGGASPRPQARRNVEGQFGKHVQDLSRHIWFCMVGRGNRRSRKVTAFTHRNAALIHAFLRP